MNDPITIFSVVRDKAMYDNCIGNNIHCVSINKVWVDNTKENLGIPKRYNDFLAAFDYSKPSWIVFAHEDFEPQEDLAQVLPQCPPDAIYGPCGARHQKYLNLVSRWQVASKITETHKDGSTSHTVGTFVKDFTELDTTDCMCVIVHSELIRQHGLRFDEKLLFDLYAEDFCANALVSHGIKTRVVNFPCSHHSTRPSVPKAYLESLDYLNQKYPNDAFGGTCSYVGGSKISRNFCGPLKWAIRIAFHLP